MGTGARAIKAPNRPRDRHFRMIGAGGRRPAATFCSLFLSGASPRLRTTRDDASPSSPNASSFRALDLGEIKRAMRQPIMIDPRNIYPPEAGARIRLYCNSVDRQKQEPGQ
jgi:hypothetical protein